MLAFHHFTMATAELFLWLIIGNGEGGEEDFTTQLIHSSVTIM